ncbi:MAG: carboxypeptidase M32 [Oscillospiraceae bacterium]|nr:carboxypeptidase M32 [Oscillospiraceae bacterium]
MTYESLDQALAALRKHHQTMYAYHHALNAIHQDAATVAPKNTSEGRAKAMEILSGVTYGLVADPANGDLLDYLEAHMDELDDITRRQVEVFRKGFDQLGRIPAEEYVAYSVLISDAENAWEKAKNASDFNMFAPYLQQIVDFNRKFAGYYDPEKKPYDALLNEFEEGLTMETLDAFFAQLRGAIVPLLAKIQAAPQVDDSFLHQSYPVEQQKKLADYLMEVQGLDRGHCGIAESEHPYTLSFNAKDTRITTHYYEDHVTFAMYSTIHEGGHAIYDMGGDDCYEYTNLAGGVSMGIHESQSRFYENLIGRSRPYIHAIFPKFQELFPEQTKGVTAEMLYRAVNKVEPSLIRTESDELTYALHIMVRYEIEKKMIDGTLAIKDVPAEWNRLYKEYLGIDVPDDKHGCLQDSHWSGGAVGYFPSYAIGSAYGAQMMSKMKEDLGDVYADVAKGDLSRVTAWLHEKIHRFASFKKPGQLFEDVCGKFDAKYFTDYLTEKFTELYHL